MARRFIAGVADVTMYMGDTIIATAKTLLDSSISITSSAEDVRGGPGAQLFGKYYHTSTFDINLTDTMFKLEYIALQTGSPVSVGSNLYADEQVTISEDGTGTITGTPVAFGSYGLIGWVTLAGKEEYTKVTFTGKTFTPVGIAPGSIVCVKYPIYDAATRVITISSAFVPDTVRLVMVASLFDGGSGANALESSTKVGYVTVEVPRFQFNGTQEISMTATGVSNTPIAGSALSNISADCGQNGYYAEIKETITGAKWYDNVIMLAIEDADFSLAVGTNKTLAVYAIPSSGRSFICDNTNLTFTASGSNVTVGANTGVVTGAAAGKDQVIVTITEKTSVEAVANITVTANP